MKTLELTDEQRASILGDNAAKLEPRQRDDPGVQELRRRPSDDRRLTVLHRRESGPSSIYFAAAS